MLQKRSRVQRRHRASLCGRRFRGRLPALAADLVRRGVAGANVTSVTSFSVALLAKRLQLLHELAPKSAAIAVLLDPNAAEIAPEEREAKEAARALGRGFSDDCPCAPRRAASGVAALFSPAASASSSWRSLRGRL